MNLKLTKPFASNSNVDEFDVRQMKKALNRLGYYTPRKDMGIHNIPDREVFTALKSFQADQGLQPTGTAKPGDETESAVNEAVEEGGEDLYIWRTVRDEKVRQSHAAREGLIFSFDDYPDPGDEINCRCSAEWIGKAGLYQEVTSPVRDAAEKWNEIKFTNHFYNGGGQTVTLHEMGYLQDVINKAREIMFWKVENQVADEMRKIKNGELVYDTENSYPELGDVFWVFGPGTIRTLTTGEVKKEVNI